MTRLFSSETLKSIWREDGFDVNGDWFEAKVIEEGEWDDQGKYQYLQVVFEYAGKTCALNIQRSGSYFSEYDYDIYDDALSIGKGGRIRKKSTIRSYKAKLSTCGISY